MGGHGGGTWGNMAPLMGIDSGVHDHLEGHGQTSKCSWTSESIPINGDILPQLPRIPTNCHGFVGATILK